MSRAWALVMGSRAWLVGILVWLVAASFVYAQNDNQRPAAVLGLLLTFLVGGTGVVRVLWSMRTYGNPPKLVAAGKNYDLHTYTGLVGSASKTASTTFQAHSTLTHNPMTGDAFHQLSTTQNTSIQDNVTLHGADGTQHNVQVRDVNLSVGAGQLVSAAWAIRPGRKSGPYVLFRNHTTGQNSFPRGRLWWLATGRGAVGFLISMWIGALLLAIGGHRVMAALWFTVIPFAYIGAGYFRAARFRSTSRALATFLDGVAATFQPDGRPVPSGGATSAAVLPGDQATSLPPVEGPPAPRVIPPPPPSWGADPTGRHEHRFWDGSLWTEHVADAGVAATDPI